MYQSNLEQKIAPIITPALNALGFALVRVSWQESGRRVLQVMADRIDGSEITIDDCAEISHTISAVLDVEDPITSAYDLEVSSAGVDRPLVRLDDFTTYQGHAAKIEMQLPVNGRKRFKGQISSVDAENKEITLTVDNQDFVLDYDLMQTAKLVMTDALIEQALAKQKLAEDNKS